MMLPIMGRNSETVSSIITPFPFESAVSSIQYNSGSRLIPMLSVKKELSTRLGQRVCYIIFPLHMFRILHLNQNKMKPESGAGHGSLSKVLADQAGRAESGLQHHVNPSTATVPGIPGLHMDREGSWRAAEEDSQC